MAQQMCTTASPGVSAQRTGHCWEKVQEDGDPPRLSPICEMPEERSWHEVLQWWQWRKLQGCSQDTQGTEQGHEHTAGTDLPRAQLCIPHTSPAPLRKLQPLRKSSFKESFGARGMKKTSQTRHAPAFCCHAICHAASTAESVGL